MLNQNIVKSKTAKVSCDGDEGSGGHPRIYLNIKPEIGFIVCPYCSKKFELE
ncbi:MAG: hypothetical protein CBC47_02805 [Alphaproteobacteria bacterium TMED87]|nr:hypothetical protein [Rhodospirillaceae bacterium]OUV10734.1 MAG: hypothetical protein CBC47_02805 [Alphaproteobacteria bacterium TMED87]|tara:strand:+ start:345 stop:500 length:156 start_codon:yes stop_codon:yes gene_type:complete